MSSAVNSSSNNAGKEVKDKSESVHDYITPITKPDERITDMLATRAGQEQLLQLLQARIEEPHFRSSHGLKRNTKCTCTKKEPCQPEVDHHHIFALLLSQDGKCFSCAIPLTMFDLLRRGGQRQKITCFTLANFQVNACKTKDNVARCLCQGCYAMMEACFCDKELINYYRGLLFHNRGDKVSGHYFPRLDYVDPGSEDGENPARLQTVRVTAIKACGSKRDMYTQWVRQRGFVVYALPPSLQSEYYLHQSAASKSKPAQPSSVGASCTVDFNPIDFVSPQNTSAKKRTIVPAATEVKKPPAKKQKIAAAAAAALDNEDSLERRQSAAAKEKLSKKLVKVGSSDYCDRNPTLVTFYVPIEPRKAFKTKSLAYVALTSRNRAEPISQGNYLFTSTLLLTLERELDYEEFLRWGLTTFRLQQPKFERPTPFVETLKSKESDALELEQYRGLLQKEAEIREQHRQLGRQLQEVKDEKQEFRTKWASRILRAYEANENLEFFAKYQLEPRVVVRRGSVRALNADTVSAFLPRMLVDQGLIVLNDSAADKTVGIAEAELINTCQQISEQLFSEDVRGRTQNRLNFALKLLESKDKDSNKKKQSVAGESDNKSA